MDPLMVTGDVCNSIKDDAAISELEENVKMVSIPRIYKCKHVNTCTNSTEG